MTVSSGNLYPASRRLAFVINEKATVMMPTRPININKMINNLPNTERYGVNPIVNPTVPKAEKLQKQCIPVQTENSPASIL